MSRIWRVFLVVSVVASTLNTVGDVVALLAFGEMPSTRRVVLSEIGSFFATVLIARDFWDWFRRERA